MYFLGMHELLLLQQVSLGIVFVLLYHLVQVIHV